MRLKELRIGYSPDIPPLFLIDSSSPNLWIRVDVNDVEGTVTVDEGQYEIVGAYELEDGASGSYYWEYVDAPIGGGGGGGGGQWYVWPWWAHLDAPFVVEAS